MFITMPLPVQLANDFESATSGETIIVEGYGMTELSPIATINPVNKEARMSSPSTAGDRYSNFPSYFSLYGGYRCFSHGNHQIDDAWF